MPGDPDTNLPAVHHVVLSLDGPFGLGSGASGEKSSIRMYFLTVLRSMAVSLRISLCLTTLSPFSVVG